MNPFQHRKSEKIGSRIAIVILPQVLAAVLLQQPLRRRLHEACRSMAAAADASRVAASNLAVLKICGCTALLAGAKWRLGQVA